MHRDLLNQAEALARLDSKKPRQANLRRAVSSAYYAFFHFLVEESCRSILGTQSSQAAFRSILARAFQHGVMKSACESFAGGTLPKAVAKGLPAGFAIPVEFKDVADTFVEIQDYRQLADYDLSERFTRNDVLGLIEQVESAINDFGNVSDTNLKRFYLACLLSWNTLGRR